jgi:hypothetical protein
MNDGDIGRLLVASLHQAIADVIPARLEFYEVWLSPKGLRDGRIGLGPLAAVLSFLRQEQDAYHLVAARAGEYAAEWTVNGLSPLSRGLIHRLPERARLRAAMLVARRMVRGTYRGSRATVRWSDSGGAMDIRGSIFCGVRDRAERPLCDFYASAVRRLLFLFGLPADVQTEQCRATGGGQCLVAVAVRREEA